MKWILLIVFFPSNHLLSQTRDTTLAIYFSTNVYELDSSQTKHIEEFAAAVSGISKVTGYADSVGTVEYNLELSRERANTVARLLKENLPGKLIEYKGETFVRSSDLSKNRMVEIIGYLSAQPIVDMFDLDYIWFIADKPVIAPESLPNVQRLVTRLKGYHHARFQLIGHVNYESKRPSALLNSMFKLSEQRAGVIREVLIGNGIPAARIQSRGAGNTEPIFAEPANDEERRKNMRVQVIVYSLGPD